MKQTKPFSVIIDNKTKKSLQLATDQDGIQRGIFFSTSGKALIEYVNPRALYTYLFKTKIKS